MEPVLPPFFAGAAAFFSAASLSFCSIAFQNTENTMDCAMLVMRRVLRPRPKRPATPSFAMTPLTAPMYPRFASPEVCLMVFTTRRELDTQSDTKDAHMPMTALRASCLTPSYLGMFACR